MLGRTGLDGHANGSLSPILTLLRQVHEMIRPDRTGRIAAYIPELATADPDHFGIALATADGHVYEVGDTDRPFTIQSVAKPFVYGLALEDHGPERVLSKVGVEPSGDPFNSIAFDERSNRPFNPMVNAGAIATTALVAGEGYEARLQRILAMLGGFAGRPLAVDETVKRSEQATGHRNRAIGYLALNAGMVDERIDEHLDLYFAQCSVLVTARDLAVMAATLARGGVNPLTGERALSQRHVASVLSVMLSCGMYDYSGEWGLRVGIPAKSGVAGGIIAVLPGLLGIGTYSPLLDERGNSRRGVRACDALAARLNLHPLRADPVSHVVFRRRYRGDTARSKRRRNRSEQAALAASAAGIAVYELQGALSFGTMEQVLRLAVVEAPSVQCLLLDLKRVLEADHCAAGLLGELRRTLEARDTPLLLSHVSAPIADALREAPDGAWPATRVFPDTDAALEWCEDRLLARDPAAGRAEMPVPLAAMDITAGLDAGALARLAAIAEEVRYPAGARIIREGDAADALFLLAAGRASVSLRLGAGERSKRVNTIAPGVAFGDLALFGGGARSADVVADRPSLCYVVPIDRLEDVARQHPEIRARLMANVVREMSARLRNAEAEIRALEE